MSRGENQCLLEPFWLKCLLGGSFELITIISKISINVRITNIDLQNYKCFWIFDENRHTYLGNNNYELETVNGPMAWSIFILSAYFKFLIYFLKITLEMFKN